MSSLYWVRNCGKSGNGKRTNIFSIKKIVFVIHYDHQNCPGMKNKKIFE